MDGTTTYGTVRFVLFLFVVSLESRFPCFTDRPV